MWKEYLFGFFFFKYEIKEFKVSFRVDGNRQLK